MDEEIYWWCEDKYFRETFDIKEPEINLDWEIIKRFDNSREKIFFMVGLYPLRMYEVEWNAAMKGYYIFGNDDDVLEEDSCTIFFDEEPSYSPSVDLMKMVNIEVAGLLKSDVELLKMKIKYYESRLKASKALELIH